MKVANVKKDNYNINIMENFPMDIEIGPNVRKREIGPNETKREIACTQLD